MGYQEPNVSPMSWIFLWGIKYTVNIIAGNMSMHWKKKEEKKKKKEREIAAREFRVWSPTTLLGLALSSLTTVDRTGNGAFC